MNIIARFKKLNLWNKFFVIAGIVTIISFMWPRDKVVNNPIVQKMQNSPGGIQVARGTVIIKTEIPEPKIEIKGILVDNEPFQNMFRTEILLEVNSKIPINNLYLAIQAPSIVKMEAIPQRSGVSFSGHSGVRDGYVFTNLQNAYGTYKIEIFSRNKERFGIVYNTD